MSETGAGIVTVAPVRPDEHAGLGRICVAAYAELDYPLRLEYAAELADVAGRAADANAVVLAARLDGELAGHATVVLGSSPLAEHIAAGEAMLRMVAVAPAMQGHGVGTALLREALAHAAAAGLRRMRLYTQPQMRAARRMYEHAGFRRVPERDTTVLDGTLQLLAYERELTERS